MNVKVIVEYSMDARKKKDIWDYIDEGRSDDWIAYCLGTWPEVIAGTASPSGMAGGLRGNAVPGQ